MLENLIDSNEGFHLHGAAWSADGPPIVLLHGVTRRWQDWLPIVPVLASTWEVRALDFRGHGESSRAPGAYRVIDYVPDIVAYLEGELESPAILIGHSLGGMVAAAVAAELHDRVRGLVLEDPTFHMTGDRIQETGFPDLFRAFQPHAGSDRPLAEIAAALAEAPIRVPNQDAPARLGDLRDPASLRFSAACLKRLDPNVLDWPLEGRWLDCYDVDRTLRRIACPTLLLQADCAVGGALPDSYAQELADQIADCTLIKLDGIAHNIHSSQPEAMARLVLPFLASLD